jgi:hypothetical protein
MGFYLAGFLTGFFLAGGVAGFFFFAGAMDLLSFWFVGRLAARHCSG